MTYLECDLCGCAVEDTPEANIWYGVVPYPGDSNVTGMCRGCGGDPTAKTVRGRLGRATTCFVDARIAILRDALSPDNRAKFDASSYERQAMIIFRMVEKGLLV